MKTKIIPFDLETAKKIQAGEIKGKIIYNGSEAEIFDFHLCFKSHIYVCAKTKGNCGEYATRLFDIYGKDPEGDMFYDLVLEVPDTEPQFKPFDMVLVRDDDTDEWCPALYAYRTKLGLYRMVGGSCWEQCITYEGHENLLGSMCKPKEDYE